MVITFSGCVFVLSCLLSAAPQDSRPASAASLDETAERIEAAFRAGDDAALRGSLRAAASDAFLVADALFARHVEARLAGRDSSALPAAARLAGLVAGADATRRLSDVVATWTSLDERQLRVEQQAHLLLAEVAAAQKANAADRADALLRRAVELPVPRPWSVAANVVWAKLGVILQGAGRHRECLPCFERALAGAQELGWREREAAILRQIGTAHYYLNEHARCVAALDKARALNEQLAMQNQVALTLRDLGAAHERVGNLAEACTAFERMLRILKPLGDRRAIADAHIHVGRTLGLQVQPDAAWQHLSFARDEMRELGDRRGECEALLALPTVWNGRADSVQEAAAGREALASAEAFGDLGLVVKARSNLGGALERASRLDEAAEQLERASGEAKARGDERLLASIRCTLGQVENRRGRFASALSHLEASRGELLRLDSPLGAARAGTEIGRVLVNLQLWERARACLDQALLEHRANGSARAALGTQRLLAMVEQGTGRKKAARELLQKVHAGFVELGPIDQVCTTLVLMANLESEFGRYETSIDLATQALKIARERRDPHSVSVILGNLGKEFSHLGRHREALDYHLEALETKESIGDLDGSATTLGNIALACLRLDRPRAALQAARRSLEIRLRTLCGLGEDSFTLQGKAVETSDCGIDAAWALFAESAQQEACIREAFWFAEAGRALQLADGIANRHALLQDRVAPETLAAEAAARDALLRQQEALRRLASQAQPDPALVAAARRELDRACDQLAAVVARVQREARSSRTLVSPAPPDPDALRAILPDDGALIVYQHVPGRSARALVLTREGFGFFTLPGGAELGRRVERYLRIVAAPDTDDAILAGELYDTLLRPLHPALAGKRKLIVSPDGELAFLPFEALLGGAADRRERAVERWQITYVPSAAVYALLRERETPAPGICLLALGDPLYPGEGSAGATVARDAELRGIEDLARLVGSGDEVRAIAALFGADQQRVLLRGEASRAGLLAELQRPSGRLASLHIACHGHLDADRPRLTGIVLAGGEVLTLDDVYRMRIDSDLVVLSACESGKGKLARGEGVLGLVHGFLSAGAARVIATDWPVHDAGARRLMVEFYRRKLADGLDVAAALRAAKLARRRAGDPPAHWAGFVLWGLP